jgi:hypothetical protein
MLRIRAILGLVLAFGLLATLAVQAADDNVKKKKKGANATFGTVTKVDEKDGSGTISIKPGAGGKGVKGGANAAADAANADEKKFTFDKDTTFEKIAGKKKKDTATFKDCVDQRVMIVSADGKKADKVTILPMAKKAQ